MKKLLCVSGVALWVALSLAGVSAAQEDPAARLRGLSGAAFEIAFMQEMIIHHQMAVEMAQVALERATRDELKTLSRNIIAGQGKEIDQMTAWLKDWHGVAPKAMDHAVMQEMDREMAALKAAGGVEFDRKFAEDMIVHHQSAIEMAQLVAERATNDELKALAQEIINAQAREVAQMREWLQAWGSPAPAQQRASRLARWLWVGGGAVFVLVLAVLMRRQRAR